MFRRILPYLLGFLGVVVLANLIALDFIVFQQKPPLTPPLAQSSPPIDSTQSLTCTTACQEEIARAVAAAQIPVDNAPAPSPSLSPKPTSTPKPGVNTFYIPLGTGYTQNNDWENAYAAESAIDTETYGEIKEAHFEANLRVPVANGTVYARLYNVTDNHPVWNSEVSTSQGTSTHLVSSAITLDKGNKLYRVQIKTSLQYPSYLDFARVNIQVQ